MPSEQHDNFATLMAAGKLTPDTPIDQMRTGYDGLGLLLAMPDGVTCDEASLGGVPVVRVVPAERDDRTIVYFHGGGYVIGSSQSHRPLAAHLAVAARAEVILVDYRRAPEDPFPAAVDDAAAVYADLLAGGADAAHVVLAGDSAGGGLALALLVRARSEGLALPAGAALLSPLVDAAWKESSVPDEIDPILSKALGDFWIGLYAGDTPLEDPLLSPTNAELAGLPPLLIEVGTREILLDQDRAFADKARAAGVEVELGVEEGLMHHWPVFAGAFPEADATIARVADWVVARTG